MRVSVLLGLAYLALATPAAATDFVVNVLAPPTISEHDGDTGGSGFANFPDVILHVGDQLTVNVDYGVNIVLDECCGNVGFNIGRGLAEDSNQVFAWYPYYPNQTFADGFSLTATVVNSFGHPSSDDAFDFKSVFYSWQPVPEPSSWAMMLMGFGSVGALLRRASKQQLSARRRPAAPAGRRA